MRSTMDHVVSADLEELIRKRLENSEDKNLRCQIDGHDKKCLDYYCGSCEVTFCEMCSEHFDHSTFNIAANTQEVHSKTEVLR